MDRFSVTAALDFLSSSLRFPGVGLEPRSPRALVELIGVLLRGVLLTSGPLVPDDSLLVTGLWGFEVGARDGFLGASSLLRVCRCRRPR
jgi:hypothetical protein